MKSFVHIVKINIEGFKIDRLLDAAMAKRIRIKQVSLISETKVTCYVESDDLEELRKLAKPLYKITVVSNSGLVYRLKGLTKNFVLICLALFTVMLVICQSFFVKTIEISGYKGIPEVELRECLEEAGIREGSFIPRINWNSAENHIYDVFPEVSWLQLVYDGRKVILNISEGEIIAIEENPWVDKPKYYCNIVADYSGYIEKINTYRGIALVEPGDYVEEGQILILGCVPIKEKYHVEDADTEYLVKSKGEIWAVIPHRLSFKEELYDDNNRVRSEKQIIEKTEQLIRAWAKENLPENAEILNKDLNFCYKENIIEVGVTLEIRRQIGEEQEILIGQKNSDSSGY